MVSPQHSKILIVEDDPDMLELIAEHFSIFGFKILKASSGNEASEVLKDQNVSIIISDIHMEDGDGIALLKQVKSQDIFKPNFYFISGFADHELKEVLDMGADGLFFKPFDASTLRSSIKKSLLPRTSHWSTKPCETENLKVIEVDELDPHWGRGGLSFNSPEDLKVGEFINFSSSWNNKTVNGTGRVIWTDDKRAGVEIEYLPPAHIQNYEQFLESQKPLAYIPV